VWATLSHSEQLRISAAVRKTEYQPLAAIPRDDGTDWYQPPGSFLAEVRIPDDSETVAVDSESAGGCHTFTSAVVERWNSDSLCFEDTDDELWVFDRGGATLTPGGKYTVKLMESGFRGRTLAYVLSASGGSGGTFDGYEGVVFPVDEDCDLDPLGGPVTVGPTYSGTQIISSSTIGNAFVAHPSGRTWDGSNDRLFEANGRVVNPGTRVILYYAGQVNHDNMDGTFTTFRQWIFYYNERDPTCLVRVVNDLSAGENECSECYTYLAFPGQLITNEPTGAPCVLDRNGCFDDSES